MSETKKHSDKNQKKIDQAIKKEKDSKNIARYKSRADYKQQEKWQTPLQRRVNPDGSLIYQTVRVRVFSGDAEHDFVGKFPSGELLSSKICKAIADKERLDEREAGLFSLWVIAKDIEIQVRKDDDLFKLMIYWHKWVFKYTHFPEAINPKNEINQYWLVYRRSAHIPVDLEIKLAGKMALELIFGEVL